MHSRHLALTLLAFALPACGDGTTTIDDGGIQNATTYMPFASANYASQRARVSLFEEQKALRAKADFDKSKCGNPDAQPAAGTLAEIYLRNDSSAGVFRDKIKTLTGEHSYDKGAPIGTQMDAIITAALKGCDDGSLPPAIAGQLFDKSLQWFFYGETFEEANDAAEGTEMEEKWDEAFGYYGRSTDGSKSQGIAGTMEEVDEQFQLSLDDAIWKALIAGRAQVAQKDMAGLKTTVSGLDRNLLTGFAYITGHEFAEFATEADPAVELAEGKGYFNIIESYMKTVAPTDAAYIREQLDKTPYTMAKSIDAKGIIDRLQKAFGITIVK